MVDQGQTYRTIRVHMVALRAPKVSRMDPAPSLTVHVVDSDAASRQSISDLVSTVGLSVKTHSSAVSFMETCDFATVGCVITEVRMPKLSGLELQKRIKRVAAEIPVIILTAYANVELTVRAFKNGAVDFLEKPIGEQVLLDAVNNAIKKCNSRRKSSADTRRKLQCFEQLTSRETQVLDLVVEGMSSKKIGAKLGVSFKTVEAHRSKIMKKTSASSLPHLIRMWIQVKSGTSPQAGTLMASL